MKNLNLSDHFLFVASDSWGTKKESIHSLDSVAEGTITFAPKTYQIEGRILNQKFYENIFITQEFFF